MSVHVKVAGTWRTVTAPSIRPAGSYVPATEIHVKVAGSWEQVWPVPLTVDISPNSINEVDGNCPFTSSSLTGQGSGGVPSYTYAWAFISGGAGITINSPSSQSTTFTITSTGLKSGTVRCTVTDQNTDTAIDTASVTLECGGA